MPAAPRASPTGCCAVHDGDFGTVNLHAEVVDAQSRERGQQVLDGGDAGVTDAQRGGQRGVGDELGADGDHWPTGQVDASEDKPVVGRGRQKAEGHLGAAVKANALNDDCPLKCSLLERVAGHDLSRPFVCRVGARRDAAR